jgi:hypothetical protein
MCDDIVKQREREQQQQQQSGEIVHAEPSLQEQLNALQSWDITQDGQSLEQRREAERERIITRQQENQGLQQAAEQLLGAAPPVEQVAQGVPVQTVTANQTYKQKREEKRRDKVARKQAPYGGDHVSYNIREGLAETTKQNRNSITSEIYEAARVGGLYDPRILYAFARGHKTDKKGEPLTEQDRINKAWDLGFAQAFSSRELEPRIPYLRQITHDFLTLRLDKSDLSIEKIEKNPGEYKKKLDLILCMDNIKRLDPVTIPYFANLPPGEREMIALKEKTAMPYSHTVQFLLALKGIDVTSGDYEKARQPFDMAVEMLPLMQQEFDAKSATAEQEKKEIIERQFEREFAAGLQSARQVSEGIKQGVKADAELGVRFKDITLTSGATLYIFENIAKYREMIEKNAANFNAHKDLLSSVYRDYYRAADSLGDLTEVFKACQIVESDNHTFELERLGIPTSELNTAISELAHSKNVEAQQQFELIEHQASILGNVMQFYLREKPLSEDARAYLLEHGVTDAELDAELQRRADA